MLATKNRIELNNVVQSMTLIALIWKEAIQIRKYAETCVNPCDKRLCDGIRKGCADHSSGTTHKSANYGESGYF